MLLDIDIGLFLGVMILMQSLNLVPLVLQYMSFAIGSSKQSKDSRLNEIPDLVEK